jgi:hypothetical protein
VNVSSVAIEIEGKWDAIIPDAVSDLTVGTTTTSTVPLTWTDVSGGVRYLLYRNTTNNSGTATLIGVVNQGVQTYTDDCRTQATTYYYWAKSESSDGSLSAFSTVASGTTATVAFPTVLSVGTPGATSIPLTWTDGASSAYTLVYQNTTNDSGTASLVGSAVAGAQSYTVTGLDELTAYYFWVKNLSTDGQLSAFSTGTTGTTGSSGAGLPSALAVTVTGRTTARLSWADGAGNSYIEVYRGNTSTFTAAAYVALVNAGVQVYVDDELSAGGTYYWWVKGRNSSGGTSNQGSFVTASTYGTGGVPGEDMIGAIITAAKGRLADILATEFKELPYSRDLEKNDKIRRDRGYGVLMRGTEPGEAAVFRSYTQTLSMDVILTRAVQSGKYESGVATAEAELAQWFDRIIRDFKTTNLYRKDLIVKIGDPSSLSPEYYEDTEMVAMRYTFPVQYRNALT